MFSSSSRSTYTPVPLKEPVQPPSNATHILHPASIRSSSIPIVQSSSSKPNAPKKPTSSSSQGGCLQWLFLPENFVSAVVILIVCMIVFILLVLILVGLLTNFWIFDLRSSTTLYSSSSSSTGG